MSRLVWGSLAAVVAAVGLGVSGNYALASLPAGLAAVGLGFYWTRDDFDPEKLRGATVVITGCSTGIGEEVAYQYARLGAKILITARRENRLKEVVAKAKSLGAQEAHYVAGDMGKAEDCERTIQTAKEKFGRLDYLILNHGGSNVKSIHEDFAEKSWDEDPNMEFLEDVMKINFIGYVRLATLALPLLKESKGSIVVVTGPVGKVPVPNMHWEAALKFGVDGFFSCLRLELLRAGHDVSVTLAIMGFTKTPAVIERLQKTEKGRKRLKRATPIDQTARAIIRGGATRAREIYYPASFCWTVVTIGAIFPSLLDKMFVRMKM
ncbi:hydroxysteroid 11-beta-dehydrogenase 1-like protein [Branchiostoma floridae]|uniref:Hydroxysteroid 11-beta-dehydrogenase 1-like protein n=1 Tax=Branchiostoma floridae TaxID=7739 RepID=A0A9J7LVM6_BRAFL|nr:hydroxysteroid 11-beta-dehydrogenase 1-like protein [Branchiostoma floridae]